MDVYSFGVLVAEMCRNRPPGSTVEEQKRQLGEIKWPAMKDIVRTCIMDTASDRPSMSDILERLRQLRK